ncbi:MAG: hypothetical protein JWR72_1909 [Flavisolibacter sp.]|jgi:hypothetical protein|nr:hypothetical protein [Flavisolibacter sp.]
MVLGTTSTVDPASLAIVITGMFTTDAFLGSAPSSFLHPPSKTAANDMDTIIVFSSLFF